MGNTGPIFTRDSVTGVEATLLGSYNTSGSASGLAISADGQTAYVADSGAGLQIIELSHTASITINAMVVL